MILQKLDAFYQRLESDGDESLVLPGFSRQNITFCVDLNPDGTLANIRDERTTKDKKILPKKLQVLGNGKPPGQGINPCFLWDNTAYMLGFKPEDAKPERTQQSFEAFRDKHLSLKSEIPSEAFRAVCDFLEKWDPENASAYPTLVDVSTGFGVFHIVGESRYVHEDPVVQDWWRKQQNESGGPEDEKDSVLQCLLTGERASIARIHEPKIQGVNGAQSVGALLVSFNFPASQSYGREQSYVAPVSKDAAFRYTVALNRLLDRAGNRRVQIGDATTVFWTEHSAPIEDQFPGLIDGGMVEDLELAGRIRSTLDSIRQGRYEVLGDAKTPFYILGLSPNAARLSVRFWWSGTIGALAANLASHFDDMAIDKPANAPKYPATWQILRETARESKDIPPNLSGSLMRSIFTGSEYPPQLLQALIRRIKADGTVSPTRAAAIKASLNRTFRLFPNRSLLQTRLEMTLDPNRPEVAYQLGRLFAVLEKTQEDSVQGSLNATIKDRFFSAASATPAVVFPRLIRMSQHHIGKLEKAAYRVSAEKRMQEIFSQIEKFPSHLDMQQQGLFAIGYYHQRQDFFTKKPAPETNDS